MFDLESFIKTFSYVGIFAIVFAESGLLIGILLPGDSLLFISGFLASQGHMNIAVLITGVFLAAVIGDSVGYHLGRKFGPSVFKREESRFLNAQMIERAKDFYRRHGGKTIIFARFTPFVRTLAPLLAGVGHMDYKLFLVYNLIGGAIWAIGITLLGYFLGSVIPNLEVYLLPAVALMILISAAPSAWHFQKQRRRRSKSD